MVEKYRKKWADSKLLIARVRFRLLKCTSVYDSHES